MEFLKNIFSPFSERAKSPFFGAFLVSWILINWRIIFIVLFLSHKDFGGNNMIEFIQSQDYFTREKTLTYPILSALLYLFAWPFIEINIFRIVEELKRKKIDEKIRIGREHSIHGNIFYDLKLKFEEEKKNVLAFEAEKLEYNSKITELTNIISANQVNLERASQENEENLEKLTALNNRNETKFLEGRWHLKYQMPNDPKIQEENIEIRSNEYHVIDGTTHALTYRLDLVDYDPFHKQIEYIKVYNDDIPGRHKVHAYVKLRIIDNDTLEGYENGGIRVSYKRQYFMPSGEITDPIVTTWEAVTQRSNPQWADYKEINLDGSLLRSITCKVFLKSNYLRFGVKLMDRSANIFGTTGITTEDNSMLMHIGKENDDNKIGFTSYRGTKLMNNDTIISNYNIKNPVNLKILIDNENTIECFINDISVFQTQIPYEMQKRICLFAWGDGNEFKTIVKDILIKIR